MGYKEYTPEEVDFARFMKKEGYKTQYIREEMEKQFKRKPSNAAVCQWFKTMKDDRLNAAEMDINILMEEITTLKARISELER